VYGVVLEPSAGERYFREINYNVNQGDKIMKTFITTILLAGISMIAAAAADEFSSSMIEVAKARAAAAMTEGDPDTALKYVLIVESCQRIEIEGATSKVTTSLTQTFGPELDGMAEFLKNKIKTDLLKGLSLDETLFLQSQEDMNLWELADAASERLSEEISVTVTLRDGYEFVQGEYSDRWDVKTPFMGVEVLNFYDIEVRAIDVENRTLTLVGERQDIRNINKDSTIKVVLPEHEQDALAAL
jgi:hypothetical protein